jgi:hypothetical protein
VEYGVGMMAKEQIAFRRLGAIHAQIVAQHIFGTVIDVTDRSSIDFATIAVIDVKPQLAGFNLAQPAVFYRIDRWL